MVSNSVSFYIPLVPNVTKLSPNTHRSRNMLECMINRSLTSATTKGATRLSARLATSLGTRESIQGRNPLSVTIVTRNLQAGQTLSSTCRSIRRTMVEATSSASLTAALRAICTRVVSRNTTWSATKSSMRSYSTRSKVSAYLFYNSNLPISVSN